MYEGKEESQIHNVRPLLGVPHVLTEAEQKLKEIQNIISEYENADYPESAQEAAEMYENHLCEIKKILNR